MIFTNEEIKSIKKILLKFTIYINQKKWSIIIYSIIISSFIFYLLNKDNDYYNSIFIVKSEKITSQSIFYKINRFMSLVNDDNIKTVLCDSFDLDVNFSLTPKIIDKTTTEICTKSKQKFNNELLMKYILDSVIVTGHHLKNLNEKKKNWKSILADISSYIEDAELIEDDAARIETKYILKTKKTEIEEKLNTIFIAKIEDVIQGVSKKIKLSFTFLTIISISIGIIISIFISFTFSFFLDN